jgi:hypothetical protein
LSALSLDFDFLSYILNFSLSYFAFYFSCDRFNRYSTFFCFSADLFWAIEVFVNLKVLLLAICFENSFISRFFADLNSRIEFSDIVGY